MTAPVILIVDDEKRLRELVEQYLIQAGFRVFQATDGVYRTYPGPNATP
jgi:DNA-binding response OmpR family regulator